MDFIEYCHQNRILLAIFPPHSTHTLQPLDVVLFKPLSSAYSSELAHHQQQALGHLPIKKGDFYPLFRSAWNTSFKKETILKSFEATGIWPMNPEVILKRFTSTSDRGQRTPSSQPEQPPSDWIGVRRLIQSAVEDTRSSEAKQLSTSFHHLQVQNELLNHENKGLKAALNLKQKRRKHSKALPLRGSDDYHGGAILHSPHTVQRARDQLAVTHQEEEEEHLQKLRRKREREEAKLLKQLQVEERRVERERLKEEREKERAKQALERQRLKEERDSAKALQLTQKGKVQASQAILPSNKRQKRSAGDAATRVVLERSPSPPAKVTSRGRNINLPSKFR
jgi:hypothetical protein